MLEEYNTSRQEKEEEKQRQRVSIITTDTVKFND